MAEPVDKDSEKNNDGNASDFSDDFIERIGEKEARKVKARSSKDKGLWFGLGTMGVVGWSVAIPTLIGIAIGIWLDIHYPSRISWTLTFLAIGLAVGCVNAWYWVSRQQRKIGSNDND